MATSDFWHHPATLLRYRSTRPVPLARGTVNLMIDCALAAVLPLDRLFIETMSGQRLVGREIARTAIDLTRPPLSPNLSAGEDAAGDEPSAAIGPRRPAPAGKRARPVA